MEVLRCRRVESNEELVERALETFDVARAHAAATARFLELVLLLAEALEVRADLGTAKACILAEDLLFLEDFPGRRQDALLFFLVEELELLLDGDVRRENRLHDFGVEKYRTHAVLQRADVLERLALRKILEPITGLEVAPEHVEQGERMSTLSISSGESAFA